MAKTISLGRSYASWALALVVGVLLFFFFGPRPVNELWTVDDVDEWSVDPESRAIVFTMSEAADCGALVAETVPPEAHSGSFVDADNDGDLDAFVIERVDENSSAARILFFMNIGGAYREISKRFGSAFSTERRIGELVFADFDGNAMIDIGVETPNEVIVLRNHFERRNFIALRFKPRAGKSSGESEFEENVQVVIRTGSVERKRCVQQHGTVREGTLFVGVDRFEGSAEVTVTWPDGTASQFAELKVNRAHTLAQPESSTAG